jgi:rhodanese-related sulfurtransferase
MEGFNNSNGRFWHFCLVLFICTLFIVVDSKTNAAVKSVQNTPKTTTSKRQLSGSYCGVYCLYSTMKLSNREVEFINLVKPEYIGSRLGSSFAELKQAAEDYGLYAAPVGKLTSRELRKCHYPVILHVKSGPESQQYDHYVLFLGVQDSQAKIFDPPNPVELVSFAELASLWDGNGMIVSAEPIDTAALFAPARKRFIFYSAVVIAVILLIHLSRRWLPITLLNSRSKLFGLSTGQAVGFAITALLCGMLYHFANDAGLLANANATTLIQKAHAGNFIPKISERKVHKLLDTDTVFIDARRARDYKQGHLDGAISVPVDSNDIELKKATADIAKDARVVLYCQSAGCKYAERVAIKLIEDGFNNISIYQNGWVEWKTKNGRKKGEQS